MINEVGREREEFNKLDEPPNKTHDELRMNTEFTAKKANNSETNSYS